MNAMLMKYIGKRKSAVNKISKIFETLGVQSLDNTTCRDNK